MINPNSLEAYLKISDTIANSQKLVLNVIQIKKAVTAKEISNILNKPINCITPRICELKDMGLIFEGGEVQQDGFTVTLYVPTISGERYE